MAERPADWLVRRLDEDAADVAAWPRWMQHVSGFEHDARDCPGCVAEERRERQMAETGTAARLAAIRERLEAGLYPGEANIAWLLGEVEQLTLERDALASAFCGDCRDRLVEGWRYAKGTCVHCLGNGLLATLGWALNQLEAALSTPAGERPA